MKSGGFDYFIGLSDKAGMVSVYAGPSLAMLNPMEWHIWGCGRGYGVVQVPWVAKLKYFDFVHSTNFKLLSKIKANDVDIFKIHNIVRRSDCANLPWAQKNLATQFILCWVQIKVQLT